LGGNTLDTLESTAEEVVSTKQQRIAANARNLPKTSFCALAHHVDLYWLYEAFVRTRKDAAPGIDNQSAQDYKSNLGENLRNLLERFKSGTYRAPAVRRVYIPKAGSEEKPPHRDTDVRGQGATAGGTDGAGTRLRE
jgi:retron-type reverse transcriptase